MGTTTTDASEVLTPREAAKLLKVTARTLQNWRDPSKKTYGPPWIRMGGQIRYLRAAIERYLIEGGDDR